MFDVENNTAYDPRKIHKIEHSGKFYKMNAYHQTHPSPQRTPVIFQAGASSTGMIFAGKHAEALFVAGPTPAIVQRQVQTVRDYADKYGRDGSKIKFFVGILPIIGRSVEEAEAKYKEALSNVDAAGGMARFSDFTNLDLSKYPIDEPFQFQGEQTEASIHGVIKSIKAKIAWQSGSGPEDNEPWTPRRLGIMMALGGSGQVVVGTPQTVADEFERWMNEADIDGFNIQRKLYSSTRHDNLY